MEELEKWLKTRIEKAIQRRELLDISKEKETVIAAGGRISGFKEILHYITTHKSGV
jgi:hypothetical protein